MPSIQRLVIRCAQVERSELAFGKAKFFGLVNVMVEQSIDLVSVESTEALSRLYGLELRSSLQSLDFRYHEHTKNDSVDADRRSKAYG